MVVWRVVHFAAEKVHAEYASGLGDAPPIRRDAQDAFGAFLTRLPNVSDSFVRQLHVPVEDTFRH